MRTYYCVEEMPSYPVNTILVQTRPFANPGARCIRVRASSKHEAEEKVTAMLSNERLEALEEIARES